MGPPSSAGYRLRACVFRIPAVRIPERAGRESAVRNPESQIENPWSVAAERPVRKSRLMNPHSEPSPGGSISRTSSVRGASGPSAISCSERPGEIGPKGCPLIRMERIPGACCMRRTTGMSGFLGGHWNRRVSRNGPAASGPHRVGKVRRAGTIAGSSDEAHSQPRRRWISWDSKRRPSRFRPFRHHACNSLLGLLDGARIVPSGRALVWPSPRGHIIVGYSRLQPEVGKAAGLASRRFRFAGMFSRVSRAPVAVGCRGYAGLRAV
jgi:hypothetical protein